MKNSLKKLLIKLLAPVIREVVKEEIDKRIRATNAPVIVTYADWKKISDQLKVFTGE